MAAMSQQRVRFEQFFAAPRAQVFAYFADHEKFGRIWPGRTRRLRESADAAHPNGLGSVREIRASGFTIEETITAFDSPTRIEYRVTRGGPLKNHLGRLLFTEVPGGTQLEYTIEFDPRLRLTGGLIASVLCASWHRGVHRAIDDLSRNA